MIFSILYKILLLVSKSGRIPYKKKNMICFKRIQLGGKK